MKERLLITCFALSVFVNLIGQKPMYCGDPVNLGDVKEIAARLVGNTIKYDNGYGEISTINFFAGGRAEAIIGKIRPQPRKWGIRGDRILVVSNDDDVNKSGLRWWLRLDFDDLRVHRAVQGFETGRKETIVSDISFLNPSCGECLKQFVEEAINEWQKKGEFETTVNFQSRITQANTQAKISRLQEEVIKHFEETARRHFIQTRDQLELLPYDADNETFKVKTEHFGSMVFNVPIDLARKFKNSFDKRRVFIHRFDYSPTQMIARRASVDVGGIVYHYDRSAQFDYGGVDINYNFDELDFSAIEAVSVESNSQGRNRQINLTSEEEIKFEKSPTVYSISSVAVIPKQIEDCNGTSKSADALASYAENNILAHYEVADRRHLQSILDEHKLQMSGLTFEETLLENGCIENAGAYLFVQSYGLMGEEMIEIRLVHCETATLIWSCTGTNSSVQRVFERINQELRASR